MISLNSSHFLLLLRSKGDLLSFLMQHPSKIITIWTISIYFGAGWLSLEWTIFSKSILFLLCTREESECVNSILMPFYFFNLVFKLSYLSVYYMFLFFLIILLTYVYVLLPPALTLEEEAQFGTSFPPTWVKEGDSLTLHCTFTSALLPFQQDVIWFRDGGLYKKWIALAIQTGAVVFPFHHFPGIKLHQSSSVDIKSVDNKASITLRAAHKEHEGVYTAQLKTWEGTQEHSAFVYVKGEFLFNLFWYLIRNCVLMLLMWIQGLFWPFKYAAFDRE